MAHQPTRGSNPLLQTKRGKLQQRRANLNEQISKQLRLRLGAENLLKATNDKKLKEQITLELSFVNSNLQLLRTELADLNTSVQIYQNDKCPRSVPLIPFGFRETKDVEFNMAFKDFIIDHYSEQPEKYEKAINAFSAMRKAVKTPSRNEDGIRLLFEYYNQLCCVERRFFAPGRHTGIYFQWFDSITGIPAMQRSVAFEKGSILFNIAALYTQSAVSEDRANTNGLEKAIEYFSRAAGTLHYLKENFSNSPAVDMRKDILDAFLSLLLAQAQECFFDLCLLRLEDQKSSLHGSLKLSEEAAQVSKLYNDTERVTGAESIKQYLPPPWLTLVSVKKCYYQALGHYFRAIALMAEIESTNPDSLEMKIIDKGTLDVKSSSAKSQSYAEKSLLASAHLRCSCSLYEEAFNEARMCKQLRQLSILQNILRKGQEEAEKLQVEINQNHRKGDVDEFEAYELYENVDVSAQSIFEPTLIPPEFVNYKVVDLFRDLGPPSIFCARNQWTPPRVVHLRRTAKFPGYGFSVKGDAPVFISSVESGGLACLNSLRIGDIIIGIDDHDMKWSTHGDLVHRIRSTGDTLCLTIISPLSTSPSCHTSSISSASTTSSACSSPANDNDKSDTRINTTIPSSYLTLPSNYSSKQKSSSQKSNGFFTFSTLKNLKHKQKSTGNMKMDISTSTHNVSDSSNNSSWNLRSLLFTKKYSKSFDTHLNNANLFRL